MIVKEFKQNAIYRLDESSRMIERSLSQISDVTLWKKPNSTLNSIGNLILHLCGNMTQYGLASLTNSKDERNRDEEFSIDGGYSKNELLEKLRVTVNSVKEIIADISEEELTRQRKVQGFTLSGIGIIIHVVEHYSYHTGQIAFWVKYLTNQELGFYDDFDLNTKNET